MISEENVKYSLRNLEKRKSRSFLTILSIFVGIATIFIFISFGWGLYNYVDELSTGGSADKFFIQGKGGTAPGLSNIGFTESDLENVRRTRGVYEATGYIFDVVLVSKRGENKYVFISSLDPRTELLFESQGINVYEGRNLNSRDTNRVVLGHNYLLSDKIFSTPYKLNDKIEVNGERFTIVGFMESVGNPQDDSNIYVTKAGLKRVLPEKNQYSIMVGRAGLDEMDETIERVERDLRRARNEEIGAETFTVISFVDQIEAFSMVLDMIIAFVILIALISVLVSAVNTANTMITSVLERVKEIGVIKSIGAKNSEIFNIFLFESSFLGFVAGIIGTLLGFIISYYGGVILNDLGWGFLRPHFSWILFVGCIAFATIVGAISGVVPAYHASKLKPTEALRYE